MPQSDVQVLLLAAGSGTRMQSPLPKQRIALLGESVLLRSARAFASLDEVASITVVTREEDVAFAETEMAKIDKKTRVVLGGDCRAESAKRGFLSLEDVGGFVAVADAARCLVTPEEIAECLSAARKYGAASLAKPVTDTVKKCDENGVVKSTLPRENLWLAATPQVFRFDLYKKALENCSDLSSVTDDNMLMEAAGIPVKLVPCSKDNIKITYGEDIALAEGILKKRTEDRKMTMRIGHGYDVHRLVPERKLILGGVEVPYEKGLLGHSDADVLLHAVMDALLGAVGEGDIGRRFPDNDDRYLGISSMILLSEVGRILGEKSAVISNIDVTLILQKPKVAPYVEEMRQNIAKALSVSPARVNVKATTEEHLGFTGSGEGAAAHAVALVEMPENSV